VEQEVAAGRFRKDLFYRLNAVSIVLPPLRERREDIQPLAKTFAERIYSLNPVVRFSSDALASLQNYSWPGNIRELENAVVRAAAMCDGTIRAQDLPKRVRDYRDATTEGANLEVEAMPAMKEEWPALTEVEGRYVARVLDHTGGNKQAAARLLNVDRKTLDRMIKRHNVSL
jgi:DNA-binding NtrC family response regulator